MSGSRVVEAIRRKGEPMISKVAAAIHKLVVWLVGLVVAEDPDQNEEARQRYRDVRAGWGKR